VYHRPLWLRVRVDGRTVGRHVMRGRGPFTFSVECPRQEGSRNVEITSAWTWRPGIDGDVRRLSCYLDSVTVD
jgi:hypothetical protein